MPWQTVCMECCIVFKVCNMMEVIVTAWLVDAHVFPLLPEHHHLRVDWLEVEALSVTHVRSSLYHSPCNLRAVIECMMLEHVRRAMSC